jgi:O-acetyl-ADP-ribose deacetylase (regulator of RNase III)
MAITVDNGRLNIRVVIGDLTKENTDAVVNGVSEDLNFENGTA